MFSLLLFFAQSTAPAAVDAATFDHVLLISVDGLRSDALLLDGGRRLPNFLRMMRGPHTLNARCDPTSSVTLPNHVDMLTGRLLEGPEGHHWSFNLEPPVGAILRDRKGQAIAGVFHRTAEAGISSALLASKPKFSLFSTSWNLDGETPRIQEVFFSQDATTQVDHALAMLNPQTHARSFVFLHFRAPDDAGHAAGWDLTPNSTYLKAVTSVDLQLGRILNYIEADSLRRSTTAVVLTSDHGGGIPFHNHFGHGMLSVNTRIPLLISFQGAPNEDLYKLCAATRKDPGMDPVANTPNSLAPIRNADVANLCLALLGLPPVPGSTVNQNQDLWTAIQMQGSATTKQ